MMVNCQDLSIGYHGNILQKELNFLVEAGDYFCIIGENGAGKSTLMKTLLGLLPAISGTIDIKNKNGLGYLPQQTTIQKDFPASVLEIVQSGCIGQTGWRFFYNKEEKAKAQHFIERLGIGHLSKRCFRELSGGQQERVLLARALCTSAEILLLDEPTSGLDPKITTELYELLANLNRNEKITLIVISHDLEASLTYGTKILSLGKETFFGTRDEFVKWREQKEERGIWES